MEPKCSVDVAGSVLDAEDSFGSVTLRRFESPLTRLVHIQILFLQSAFSFFFLFLVTKMALKPNSHIFFFSLELSRGEQNICWSFFFFFLSVCDPIGEISSHFLFCGICTRNWEFGEKGECRLQ